MSTIPPLTNFVYNPNAQYLFGRAYALSLGPPGQTTALQYGTIGVNPAPLKLRFEIERGMYGTSANHSKIEIYNLSVTSRQNIKKGYLVNLQAGYKKVLGTIFTGNVFVTKSDRHGPDIITQLECLDGASSITFARLDKSYPAGTKNYQILQDAATAMSVVTTYSPVGVNAGIAVGIPEVVYNNGFVAQGPAKDTLDKLLKPLGVEWTVDSGNLNIIPKKNYDGNTAFVLSTDTGLIGVPSQNEYFTQFTALLNPKLLPGALVQLVSENTSLNGFYKIRKSKFEGDTHDNKWQVQCEATIQTGIVQTLPAAVGFNYSGAVVS